MPPTVRTSLLPALLLVAVVVAGCGGATRTTTETVTNVKTVEAPAGSGAEPVTRSEAKPDVASDDATVNQVRTEATGAPYMVPSKYSPDSFAVDIWYDTRSGRDGVHFNSSTDGETGASFSAGGDEDYFTLPASGSVKLHDGTSVTWKTVVKGASSDVEVSVGATRITGSAFGENLDDRQLDPKLTVPQVLELGKLLAARGADHS